MGYVHFQWERPATLAAFGAALRRQREALGLTLDALAQATGISKPYLSNIETARTPGPPSEEKVRGIARALEVEEGRLLAGADWLRTPESVRKTLLAMGDAAARDVGDVPADADGAAGAPPRRADGTIDLDRMVLAGGGREASHEGVDGSAGSGAGRRDVGTLGMESAEGALPVRAVPLINRVAAGKAAEFGDLSYPAGVADQYVAAPDLPEAPVSSAFAVKVIGESMLPEYQAGDVVIVGAGDPKDGDDCVVRLGELDNFATTFKRVWFEKNAEGETTAVRLAAINAAYGEKVVAADQVTGIYPLMYRLVPARGAGAAAEKGAEAQRPAKRKRAKVAKAERQVERKTQAPVQDPATHQSFTTTRLTIEND